MSGVNHNHLISSPLGKFGGLSVSIDNVIDLFFGKALDRTPIRAYTIAGSPLAQTGFLVFVGHICTCILAGMGEFNTRDGTVTANGISHKCV